MSTPTRQRAFQSLKREAAYLAVLAYDILTNWQGAFQSLKREAAYLASKLSKG